MRTYLASAVVLFFLSVSSALAAEQTVIKSHGISRFGNLKYGPDFKHFDYVNPEAPKGGELRMARTSDFDSLNPFIPKGSPALRSGDLPYDTLLESSRDEPTAMYGLLAESVEYPEDKSWVIFNLREEARFHDGHPITAEDIVFSFNTLKEQGAPFYRLYYANVAEAEALDPHRVKFTFDQTDNSELPAIVGQLPALPKHYWQDKDFTATTLDPPLGSGPYRIADLEPGRTITYERVPDYWAKDLPVNVGHYNFDRFIIEYYRDETVEFEAFKAGDYDYRREYTARRWATQYNFPAVESGEVVQEIIPDKSPASFQGYFFNTRLDKFSDPRVREALSYAFDFEWLNKNIFYGLYHRLDSYFDDSELEAKGLPSEAELKYLEPYRDQLPEEVFTEDYEPPSTAPPSSLRQNLRTAQRLFQKAGWEIQDGVLTHVETGERMVIEFVENQASSDRVINPYIRNLEKLGIEARFRVVDSAQYRRIINTFDFDITSVPMSQTISPGNEQREYWGSDAAESEGSRNLAGIKSPVVDALIEEIIFAPDWEPVVAATRALDRVLLASHYTIPNWTSDGMFVAYRDKYEHPSSQSVYLFRDYPWLDTWWVKPDQMAGAQASDSGSEQ